MTLKDIANNINLALYKTCFIVNDAFEKKPIEDKLNEMGISFIKGFDGHSYSYVVVGIKGDKDKKLSEFLTWFKGDKTLKYTIAKHGWFRTNIYCFSR